MEPKIINGYVDPEHPRDVAVFSIGKSEFVGEVPALLIVSQDGEEPRVWTEEQVKELLKDCRTAQSDPGQFVSRDPHRWLGDWQRAAMEVVTAKHGITL